MPYEARKSNFSKGAGDFHYEVTNSYGVISTSNNGWTTELKMVSWNDRPAKFDIRPWSPEGDRMGKGLTMSKEELIALRDFLNKVQLEDL